MDMLRNQRKLLGVICLSLPMMYAPTSYAAKAIDLSHAPLSTINALVAKQGVAKSATDLVETSKSLDRNNTLHVRVQETYRGYQVFGADAVLHIKNGQNTQHSLTAANAQTTMNGVVYEAIDADLVNTPNWVATKEQADKVLASAVENYQHKTGNSSQVSETASELMIYIDADQKAHWAYQVSFYVAPAHVGASPAKPVYMIDAINLSVYENWDNIQTTAPKSKAEFGAGFGGNIKMGKLVYDGLKDHLGKLDIRRINAKQTCFLSNPETEVISYKTDNIMTYPCVAKDADHDNAYWDASFDAINNGYSPGNDALHAGSIIKHMYLDWYKLDVLSKKDGSPMLLTMVVHVPKYDNAFWDGSKMTFGDGEDVFYPLTSLGVAAHEISHGFTQQHSNLTYSGQSGGMNESFSDMAAQAAEVYAYGPGKNSWQIGPEIFKDANRALRYMDKPSKDCGTRTPGSRCSIDNANQYNAGLDVHYSSGVYNRFFYTLATTPGWTVQKAFDLMVNSNAHYWTKSTNFISGSCGVLSAAKDLGYDQASVKAAFDVVKVAYSNC